jgi:hypothetical protein
MRRSWRGGWPSSCSPACSEMRTLRYLYFLLSLAACHGAGSRPPAGQGVLTASAAPRPGEASAPGVSYSGAVALDRGGIYWTDYGAVMMQAKRGGPPTPLASDPESYPSSIAVDERSVYWTTHRSVLKVDKEGSAPVTLASYLETPVGIAVDAQSVYFMQSYGGGTVMKVDKEGGAPVALASGIAPSAMALDDRSVYWTVYDSGAGRGALMKVSKEGGAPVVLVEGRRLFLRLAVDERFVYFASSWVDPASLPVWHHGLMRLSKDGGAPELLLEEQSQITQLVLDGGYLYWITSADVDLPALMRAEKTGQGRKVLATNLASSTGLGVDSESVYWINFGSANSSVVRAPK